jgi:hypothetical protein
MTKMRTDTQPAEKRRFVFSSSLWPRLSSHMRAFRSRRRCATEIIAVALIVRLYQS